MTLVLKLDLDIVKMYVCTKDEAPIPNGSKVIVWTDDRQTDRQTDRQIDSTEIITYPHMQMVINKIFRSMCKCDQNIELVLLVSTVTQIWALLWRLQAKPFWSRCLRVCSAPLGLSLPPTHLPPPPHLCEILDLHVSLMPILTRCHVDIFVDFTLEWFPSLLTMQLFTFYVGYSQFKYRLYILSDTEAQMQMEPEALRIHITKWNCLFVRITGYTVEFEKNKFVKWLSVKFPEEDRSLGKFQSFFQSPTTATLCCVDEKNLHV